MAEPNDFNRMAREARLKWVPIALMRVSPMGQREIVPGWVAKIAAHFDIERMGTPTVSARDGHFYILDGQHRIEAAKENGLEDQKVQCWVYEGLSEAQESEKFLQLNDVKAVNALAKFRIGVNAGRTVESDVDRICRALDLRVTADQIEGGISAVGTLIRVYNRAGAAVLSRTLRIVRDAYGTPGLSAACIDGIGYLCQRYNGSLDEARAVDRLGRIHGGVNGLLGAAEKVRRQTGNQRGQCVAAAAVDIINAGRGGVKLPSWWSVAA